MTETLAGNSAAHARPSVHGARRSATREQKLAVGAIAVVGAVVAVFADASPTEHALIDFGYRALFVATLVMAGSRARRSSLVVSSAIAAAGSLGVFLLAAVIALGLCAVLVIKDLRDRVWGATVGLFVAVACLGLNVDLFLGSSAVVAAAAAGVLVVSGYRNSRSANRRGMRWFASGLLALWILGVVVSGVAAVKAFRPVTRAVADATEASTALQGGQTEDAVGKLERAAAGFASAHSSTSAWWTLPAHLVPGVAQHLTALTDLSTAGEALSRSAAEVGSNVDYQQLRLPTGGIDLARLETFAPPILKAERALALATATVARVDSPWLVAPVADELDEFGRRLGDLRSDVDLAVLSVRRAPALLGRDTPRRYLVLLGNPAESRDLGGHIGNWAEIVVTDGVLDLVQVGRPLELSRPGVPDSTLASLAVPESLLTLQPARYPQNWGGHLDFPTDARLAAALFEEATGRSVDGVAYADPSVLAGMLTITGPIPISATSAPGQAIDANNAVRFLTYGQFVDFDPATGDDVVTDLVGSIFNTFVATQLPAPSVIADRFGPTVREGRLRFTTIHSQDDELLARLGLNFGLPRADDSTLFFGVVHSNANPSKIDTFLTRDTSVEVSWDPTTGDTVSTVRVALRNDAPASGLPDYLIGNGNGLAPGTNSMQLAVLSSSKDLESVTIDGESAPSATLDDVDGYRHQLRVDVGPGETRTAEFVIVDVLDPDDRLNVFFAGQPTVNSGVVSIRAVAPGLEFQQGRGLTLTDGGVAAEVPGDQHSRISLSVVGP